MNSSRADFEENRVYMQNIRAFTPSWASSWPDLRVGAKVAVL